MASTIHKREISVADILGGTEWKRQLNLWKREQRVFDSYLDNISYHCLDI